MKNLIYILAFIITSCGVTKSKTTDDKSVLTTETEKKVTTREPSKVVNETKYNVKYKDTTITTTNYETKTILREVYDINGNRTTECICDGIREEIETVKSVLQNDIETRKETDHTFDLTPLIYALAVFLFVIVILAVVVLVIFTKAQKATQNLIIEALKS